MTTEVARRPSWRRVRSSRLLSTGTVDNGNLKSTPLFYRSPDNFLASTTQHATIYLCIRGPQVACAWSSSSLCDLWSLAHTSDAQARTKRSNHVVSLTYGFSICGERGPTRVSVLESHLAVRHQHVGNSTHHKLSAQWSSLF